MQPFKHIGEAAWFAAMERDHCMWTDDSVWHFTSPSDTARRTCLYIEGAGRLHTLAPYYVQREGFGTHLLLYILAGEGRLVYDGRILPLLPGQVLWLDGNEYHRLSASGMSSWDFLFLHIGGPMLSAYYALYAASGGPVRTAPGEDIAQRMQKLLARPSALSLTDELCEGAELVSLLTAILCQDAGSRPPYPIPEMQMLFASDCAQRYTLQQLAEKYDVNKFQLVKLFTQYVGMPPMASLLRARILAAQEWLRFTDENIGNIATKVGAESAAHLIRMFNARIGMTPGEYRKLFRKAGPPPSRPSP